MSDAIETGDASKVHAVISGIRGEVQYSNDRGPENTRRFSPEDGTYRENAREFENRSSTGIGEDDGRASKDWANIVLRRFGDI